MTLIWGDLTGFGPFRIDIAPPPIGSISPYQFAVADNSERVIGRLNEGRYYVVTLLEGSESDPVTTLGVFTSE